MNGWERNGKRVIKGILWSPAYVGGALLLNLEPSWQLLLYVLGCSFWSAVLDAIWPTDVPSPEIKLPPGVHQR